MIHWYCEWKLSIGHLLKKNKGYLSDSKSKLFMVETPLLLNDLEFDRIDGLSNDSLRRLLKVHLKMAKQVG